LFDDEVAHSWTWKAFLLVAGDVWGDARKVSVLGDVIGNVDVRTASMMMMMRMMIWREVVRNSVTRILNDASNVSWRAWEYENARNKEMGCNQSVKEVQVKAISLWSILVVKTALVLELSGGQSNREVISYLVVDQAVAACDLELKRSSCKNSSPTVVAVLRQASFVKDKEAEARADSE